MVSAMKDSKSIRQEKKNAAKLATPIAAGKSVHSDKLKQHNFETLEENLERERFNHPLDSK